MLFVGAKLQSSMEAISERVPGLVRIVVVGYGPSQNEDQYESWLAAALSVAADPHGADTDTALMIYSSGISRQPKVIGLGRCALVNHLELVLAVSLRQEGHQRGRDAPVLSLWVFVHIFGIGAGVH